MAMGTPKRKSGDGGYATPKWVKVSVAIALAAMVLIAVVMATGLGGDHGPGRHLPPAGTVER
jgi:hypothetical protein